MVETYLISLFEINNTPIIKQINKTINHNFVFEESIIPISALIPYKITKSMNRHILDEYQQNVNILDVTTKL